MKILDCTLRDGGYYNNWHFSIEFVWSYLQLCSDLQIDLVEIGFKSPCEHPGAGLWRNVSANSLSEVGRRFPDLEIAIMLEAKDFVGLPPVQLARTLDVLLEGSENISLIRITFLASQSDLAIKIWEHLNSKGINSALNLMQFVSLSDDELLEVVKKVGQSCQHAVLYFADSYGQLKPKDCGQKMRAIRAHCENKIGFHGHDNLGLVNANILSCVEEGVEFLDSTFMGMGRGAGNAKTETVIHLLEKNVAAQTEGDLFVFLQRKMMPLFVEYKWGANNLFAHSSEHNIHPRDTITLANEILSSPPEYRAALVTEAGRGDCEGPGCGLGSSLPMYEVDRSTHQKFIICPASRVDHDFIGFCELIKIDSGDDCLILVCCMGIPDPEFISSIDWFVTNTCENIFSRNGLLSVLKDRSKSVFIGPRFCSILRRYDDFLFEIALENAHLFEGETGIEFILNFIRASAPSVFLYDFGELADFSVMNKHKTKLLLNSFPEIRFDLSASPRLAQLS